MQPNAIIFDNTAPAQRADPARMDVACFMGFIDERADVTLPRYLVNDLHHNYNDTTAGSSGPNRLLNRPVTVTSIQEFESLYLADARLEQRAVVESATLDQQLPDLAVEPLLHIVVDGVIHDINLLPLPTNLTELVERIELSGLDIEVSITDFGGIRLALPAKHGPGTLAVLRHPDFGFPQTRRARARTIPSPMGQSVRQFFTMGGRKAVILRMGDSLPYESTRPERFADLVQMMTGRRTPVATFVEAMAQLATASQPPSTETAKRRGIEHLYGPEDTTFLLLPDLPELVALPPSLAAEQPQVSVAQAEFSECLAPNVEMSDAAHSNFDAPLVDHLGNLLWSQTIERILRLIRHYQRDKILLIALPRFDATVSEPAMPESAFLQVAETWVRTRFSTLLPGGLMSPDAILAGHIARTTLLQGTFLSVARITLTHVNDIDPVAASSNLQTCQIVRVPRGYALTGDLTTARDPQWSAGPVSRLMTMLLRQAYLVGETLVFATNGPRLWTQVREAMVNLMESARRAGALAGAGEGDSYDVVCDNSTMSQDDFDNGRMICEVAFRPTVPVERIRVRMPLGGSSPGIITGKQGPL